MSAAKYSLRVGDRVAVRAASLDTIAAWCAAFGMRSRGGRCDEPIRLFCGQRVVARSESGWPAMCRAIARLERGKSL